MDNDMNVRLECLRMAGFQPGCDVLGTARLYYEFVMSVSEPASRTTGAMVAKKAVMAKAVARPVGK